MAVIDRICAEVDRAFTEIDGLAERYPDAPAAKGSATSDLKTFVEDRKGHDRRYAIDARKIERELGWRPAETFDTGIRKTVQWVLGHADWIARVQSGAYRDWVATQYGAAAGPG